MTRRPAFRFSTRKDCNAGVATSVPAAGTFLFNTSLAVLAIPLIKIVTQGLQLAWGQTYRREQLVYQQIVTRRPAFRFSARENRNMGAAGLETDLPWKQQVYQCLLFRL